MYFRNCLKPICWLWLLLLVSCVEPFEPQVLEGANNFLVVDGFINPSGTTVFRLSRTQNLSDESAPLHETGASLVLEEQQGVQQQLTETEAGTYTLSGLDLNPAGMYRLLIRTAGGKAYASDFVAVKQTPPIDEITWTAKDNILQFYVSTHDPAQNSRYYRWEYEGTWEYTAAFNTNLKYDAVSRQIVLRPESESVYRCWRTDASYDIKLATSVSLSEDVIHQFPVMALPPRSEELRFKYSLLVKQYSLTKEAYQYWEALKKNTESIGTLFDPLPTQLTGNIHCLTAPEEPVIGYVGASSVQEKRIFVGRQELPQDWLVAYPTCSVDTIKVEEVSAYFEQSHAYMPIGAAYSSPGPPVLVGYLIAQNKCVDCRLRGTNVKPAFWQ